MDFACVVALILGMLTAGPPASRTPRHAPPLPNAYSTSAALRLQLTPLAAGQASASPYAGDQTFDISREGFAPSGWMGDATRNGLRTDVSTDAPPNARSSRRWIYQPPVDVKKREGWAAVAYQFPAQNWGDKPGQDLHGKSFTELSVWARGVPDKAGRYPMIQFKAGGATNPSLKYHSSFELPGKFVTLTGEWRRYTLGLQGKNLSSVISAFTFVLREEDNPSGAEFFLSEIEYR